MVLTSKSKGKLVGTSEAATRHELFNPCRTNIRR